MSLRIFISQCLFLKKKGWIVINILSTNTFNGKVANYCFLATLCVAKVDLVYLMMINVQ